MESADGGRRLATHLIAEECSGLGGRYVLRGVTSPSERAMDGRKEDETDGDDGADIFNGVRVIGDRQTRLDVDCRAGKEDIVKQCEGMGLRA